MRPAHRPSGPLSPRTPETRAAGSDETRAGPTAEASGESEARRSVSRVARRIEEIVDVAERVAEDIRADADREAERYLEESRRYADRLVDEHAQMAAELDQMLIARAVGLRDELTAMAAELDHTIDSIRDAADGRQSAIGAATPTSESAPAPAAGDGEPDSKTPPVEPGLRPVTYPGSRHGPGGPSARRATEVATEEVLLRATQLAVAGKDRAEIEAMLRDEFDIADPGTVVDSILGSESGRPLS
jgi:cell division septum initiation protein DivIVA